MGAMKETKDFLPVRAAGLPHDTFDSVADFCANAVGATAAMWWWFRGDRHVRRDQQGSPVPLIAASDDGSAAMVERA